MPELPTWQPTGLFPYPQLVSQVGRYVHPLGSINSTTAILNQVYFTPLFLPAARRFDMASQRIGAAAAAGGIHRLGIYADDDGVPGALAQELGTIPTDAIATPTLAISLSLAAGLWWEALVPQVAASANVFGVATWGGMLTLADMTGGAGTIGLRQQNVSGALPSTAAPTGDVQGSCPCFGLRVAA